jgi:hypothetical protein
MPAPTSVSYGNAPPAYNPVFDTVQNPLSQQLSTNPQLITHPLGKFTDALYEAQEADLRAETLRSYNDLLQKLGYLDPNTGQFIRGSIETEAQAEEMRQSYGMEIARQGVTDAMQRASTMFSGYRATRQAREESPYLEAMAQLRASVPQQLSSTYRSALQTLEDYRIAQMKLLEEAAGRKVESAEDTEGNTAEGGTSATTPPPGSPNNPYPTPPAGSMPGAPGGAQDPTHGGPISTGEQWFPPLVPGWPNGVMGTPGGAQDPSHGF